MSQKIKYEIWLGDTHSHFERGIVHFEDGTTEELKAAIHAGMSSLDTVLIEHDDFDCDSLRWFIYSNGLKFYRVRPFTPDVIFHNESGRNIEIKEITTLGDGESIEIQLYPDRVIKWADRKPNATTLAAMEEAEQMKVVSSVGRAFETVEELFEALNADEEE